MTDTAAVDQPRIRDFDFDDRDFERVRKLIYGYAGISLSSAKRDMVYSRLSRRLRQLDLESFGAYLDHVESGDAEECEAFTNALTTNLTSFFREAHHFPIFAEHIQRAGATHPQTVWCSAASTGEEPYSIAMTAVETFGSFSPPVRILASDVDTNVLDTAHTGVYSEDRVEKLDPKRVQRFFKRGTGANAGKVRVRDELRNLVTFRRINLLEDSWPMRGLFDVIFCRNVMIYFDKPTQLTILERFAPLMRSDGLLFAGHSESFHNAAHLFRLRGKTVYGLASGSKAR
ncbi:MAG: CheR family methyltransferase [Burkholderiales bacterium]|nr:CheR family methyltransferase [Burkholderiales bacterium]MDP2399229.1 CheR family methyltransferase [Burkholderiales bacterium]